MSWERRKRGGWYYTRTKRVGGRVVREYLGCGLLAQLAAENDRAAQELRAEHAALRRAELPLRELGRALDELVALELEAAGFHKHKGEWRRRRTACAN